MRALLVLLLFFSIAFQGIANAYAFKQPCPMQQGQHDMTMEQSAAADDCCNDAGAAAKTGKACKSGQACNPSCASAVVSFQASTHLPVSSCFIPAAGLILPSGSPSGVWRPPTLG